MELRYAVALFFREMRGAKLADTATTDSMAPLNFFLIAPKSHKCEVSLPKTVEKAAEDMERRDSGVAA